MAEKEFIAAKAKVELSRADLMVTIEKLKYRLKPATLAGDAWHVVKDKGSDYSNRGMHAVTDRPGAAGSAVLAILLFFMRGPIANILSRAFGSGRGVPGRVKADLTDAKTEYDLTAPVVVQSKECKS